MAEKRAEHVENDSGKGDLKSREMSNKIQNSETTNLEIPSAPTPETLQSEASFETTSSEKGEYNRLATKAPPSGIQWLDGVQGDVKITNTSKRKQMEPPGEKITFSYRKASPPGIKTAPKAQPQARKAKPVVHQARQIKLKFGVPGSNPFVRLQAHDELMKSETKRRAECTLLLEKQNDELNAVFNILRDGINDIEYTERIVAGFAKAGNEFASNLRLTSEDKLFDDKSNVVATSFGQNRLSKQRQSSDAGNSMGYSTILVAIMSCQSVLSEQATSLENNSHYLLEKVVPMFRELKIQVQKCLRDVEPLAGKVFKTIESSEAEVRKIWHMFDTLISSDVMEMNARARSVSSLKPKLLKENGGLDDAWLFAQSYKSAVLRQQHAIQFAEATLNLLYRKIRLAETSRLDRLRTIVTQGFVEQQRELYNTIPNYDSKVIDLLESIETDGVTLEKILEERSRVRLKYSSPHRSSIMNRSKSKNNLLDEVIDESVIAGIETLFGNPFSMTSQSHEVELKSGLGDFITKWTSAVVVLTEDEYIHFFEIQKGRKQSSDQDEIFQMLYPSMDFDSPEDWARGSEILRGLKPFLSLNLSKCNTDIAQIRNKIVEVIEEGRPQSRNSFFGGSSQKDVKYTVRFQSAADATKWVGAVEKAKCKYGIAPGSQSGDSGVSSDQSNEGGRCDGGMASEDSMGDEGQFLDCYADLDTDFGFYDSEYGPAISNDEASEKSDEDLSNVDLSNIGDSRQVTSEQVVNDESQLNDLPNVCGGEESMSVIEC